MEDVAAAAGVSRALVSLVMRGESNVSEKRRAAVLAAAKELGYRPNAAARSLAEQRSNTIGVVLDDLHNVFFADVVDGIHDVADAACYRLLLNTAWRKKADERQAIEAFLEYRVDAIIVLGARTSPEIIAGADAEVPVVSISVVVDGVDSVVNDDQRGAELVVDHLVSLGHTDIVHVDGGDGGGAELRRAGFVAAIERHGLEPRVIGGDYSEQAGVDAIELLLAARAMPTAIFAANDVMAVTALDRLQDADLRVPEDVNVVGYDNTSMAALRHISLTTVNQPRVDMGRRAAERVIERLEDRRLEPLTHVVEPELIVRSTSGPAPAVRLAAAAERHPRGNHP